MRIVSEAFTKGRSLPEKIAFLITRGDFVAPAVLARDAEAEGQGMYWAILGSCTNYSLLKRERLLLALENKNLSPNAPAGDPAAKFNPTSLANMTNVDM